MSPTCPSDCPATCPCPSHSDTSSVQDERRNENKCKGVEKFSLDKQTIAQMNDFFEIWHENPVSTEEAARQASVDLETAISWVSVYYQCSSKIEKREPESPEIPFTTNFLRKLYRMNVDEWLLEEITEGEEGFLLEIKEPKEIKEPNLNERATFCQNVLSENIHYRANCLFIGSANATCYTRSDEGIFVRHFTIYAAIDSNGKTYVTLKRFFSGIENDGASRSIELSNFISKCLSEFPFNTPGRGHIFLEEALAKQMIYLPKPADKSFILVPNSCKDLIPMKTFWLFLSALVPHTELKGESFRTRIENGPFSISPEIIKKLLFRPVTKFKDCLKESLLKDAN